MTGKTFGFIIAALLPMALSMQISRAVDSPTDAKSPHKMMLSVVKANANQTGKANANQTGKANANQTGTANANQTGNLTAIAEVGKAMERSAEMHHKSMDQISKTMTQPKALEVLQESSLIDASTFNHVKTMLTGGRNLRKQADDGFGGLDGARTLLNDMIHETMIKYDAEIAKCTDYYTKQCALMEVARGAIAAANYVAATARGLILDSQASINHCELSIPQTKQELKDHNLKCKNEIGKMNKNLKIIMDDIKIMTMILEMSDCDAKFLQMDKLSLLKCEDSCTHKEYVTFNHKALEQNVTELKSPGIRERIAETFADLFDDGKAEDSVKLVQVAGSEYMEAVVNKANEAQVEETFHFQKPSSKTKAVKAPKKTAFNNPPVPRTKVPSNPCTDKNAGAPSAATKRAAKCTLKKSPRCYKLQGRFLQIQAEITDSRDALMELIAKTEQSCEETATTLQTSITNDQALLSSSQTKLAAATEKEAGAGEVGRQISLENDQYNADLMKQMKTCTTNYVDYETDICALRKIRGDLFKKLQPGHTGFFQDCEVSTWTPEACTKKCAGGMQKLTRSVLSHPNGGAKCLPLAAQKRCNLGPCPVDCELAQWSEWSRCSSKCGGGLAQRVRDVKIPMQYNGKQCAQTEEAKQCNVQSCEKDCVLAPWTKWSSCSKDCDGGTKKRERFVKEPVEGSGKCASKWDVSRLQYMPCSQHRCKVKDATKVMPCKQAFDIVLVLDGTPKSGQKGFAAEIKAANMFVDAFQDSSTNFAVVHYTGPRTWSGVSKCTGKNTVEVDMETVCKVKLAQHFTGDLDQVKSTVNGLQYQPGSKLLSLALMTVQFEFALGRKSARTAVVVFIDGQPLSYRKTGLASRAIRKKARLLWVVVSRFAPLKSIKQWASRRWQENVVQVKSLATLASPATGTHLVANICPKKFPKVEMHKKKK